MKKLYLFTTSYPYGSNEKTFLEPELEVLAENFDITIISGSDNHDNTSVDFLQEHRIKVEHYIKARQNKAIMILCLFRSIISRAFYSELKEIAKDKKEILIRIKTSFWFVYDGYLFSMWLVNNSLIDETALYYTYWYYKMTLGIILQKVKHKNIKLVTRVHGYDLHDSVCKGKRQCCKIFMDPYIDSIFFIGKEGKQYYMETNKMEESPRYHINHLGAPASGYLQQFDRFEDNRKKQVRLVSCSNVSYIKRLNLIVDALCLIDDYNITWTHFGGGELEEVEKYADLKLNAKDNVKYEFAGFVSREELYKSYNENNYDCYLLVSLIEGLPIATVEALACGLPIIVTDVGSCFETYDDNGVMLPANPTANQLKEAIDSIRNADKESYIRMRNNSFNIWKNMFDSEKNARNFRDMLLGI